MNGDQKINSIERMSSFKPVKHVGLNVVARVSRIFYGNSTSMNDQC